MSSNSVLLDRIRRLNWLMNESTTGYISFDRLCQILSDMMSANVHVLSSSGKVLASISAPGSKLPFSEEEGRLGLPKEQNDLIMKLQGAMVNVTLDEVKRLYGPDYDDEAKFHLIEPVNNCESRIATMLFARPDVPFSEEDVVLCELAATIVGIQVASGLAEEEKAEMRERAAVRMALDNLSFSELAAVQTIIEELNTDDGLFVASKIADEHGITRSVIVNGLRKLESAGVIETKSLGMKGTRVKVSNPFLREILSEIEL